MPSAFAPCTTLKRALRGAGTSDCPPGAQILLTQGSLQCRSSGPPSTEGSGAIVTRRGGAFQGRVFQILGSQCAKYNAVMGKHIPGPRKTTWNLRGKQNSFLGEWSRSTAQARSGNSNSRAAETARDSQRRVFPCCQRSGRDFYGLWLSGLVF